MVERRITDEVIIDVQNVHKSFRVYYDKGSMLKERFVNPSRSRYENRDILNGISFQINKGETVALIGNNGCGKSTTLKMLTKILYPNKGTVTVNGKVSSLIELGAGFHPDMSGRENIYINASILGLKKEQVDERIDEIIRFSELEAFIDNPIRTYSSGMYMRLAFSVAINVDADILLIDEILAVGDQAFQEKCINKLNELRSAGTTVVLVSHSMGQVNAIADRCIWIDQGKIVEDGDTEVVCARYEQEMEARRIRRDQEEAKLRQEEANCPVQENVVEVKGNKTRSASKGFPAAVFCTICCCLMMGAVQDIYGIGAYYESEFIPELTFKMAMAGNTLWRISGLWIPLMLICAGYYSLTIDFSKISNMKDYWFKKFAPILEVWEVAVLLYQIFEVMFYHQSFQVSNWLRQALFIETCEPLYGSVARLSIGMMFIAPLLGKIFQRMGGKIFRFIMILAWIVLFLFPSMDLFGQANGGESSFSISFDKFSYIFYFCIGFLISLYAISIIRVKKEVIAVIFLMIATALIQLFFISRGLEYDIDVFFFTISIIIILGYDLFTRCDFLPAKIDTLVTNIGKCGVGILVIHRPVQQVLSRCIFYRFGGLFLLKVMLLWICSLVVSFLIVQGILWMRLTVRKK